MKRILLTLTVVLLVVSLCLPVLADGKEDPNQEFNLVDKVNSTLEGETDVTKTAWFCLHDASGSNSSSLYDGITIMQKGGHSGQNYVSVTSTASWHSPSINIYPFIKEGGAETYVLSFWYRCEPSVKKSTLLVRATPNDIMEDYYPDIIDRGNGNTYGQISGTSTDPDENGWRCFVSDEFDIDEDQLQGDHNWWLCFDSLPDGKFTLDFDDLVICPEDDFTPPQGAGDVKYPGKLAYATDKVIEATGEEPEETAAPEETAVPEVTPAPEAPDAPDAPAKEEKASLPWWPVIPALVVFGVIGAVIPLIAKKKED